MVEAKDCVITSTPFGQQTRNRFGENKGSSSPLILANAASHTKRRIKSPTAMGLIPLSFFFKGKKGGS